MAIRLLTSEEHQHVLKQLVTLGKSVNGTWYHDAGPEYTSLMVCFLFHNMISAETLLRLHSAFTKDWFPTTVDISL